MSLDPDVAAVQGIRVRVMSTLMAVLAAVVVVVGMRVVGLLLVSAIMIVPVAAAQQVTRSFRATAALAIVLGARREPVRPRRLVLRRGATRPDHRPVRAAVLRRPGRGRRSDPSPTPGATA